MTAVQERTPSQAEPARYEAGMILEYTTLGVFTEELAKAYNAIAPKDVAPKESFPTEKYSERMDHETAHFTRAQQAEGYIRNNYGKTINIRLAICFFNRKDGTLTFNTRTTYELPHMVNSERQKEIVEDIAAAPALSTELNNKPLSENWKKRLEKLDEGDQEVIGLDEQTIKKKILAVQKKRIGRVLVPSEEMQEFYVCERLKQLARKRPWREAIPITI